MGDRDDVLDYPLLYEKAKAEIVRLRIEIKRVRAELEMARTFSASNSRI